MEETTLSIAVTSNETTAVRLAVRTSDRVSQPSPTGHILTQNSVWYTAGSDFCYYAIAQKACRESRERLSKLKLSADERQLLSAIPSDADAVIERLKFIVDDQEKKSKRPKIQKRANEFYMTFCEVIGRTSGLIHTLLPQSPEYTIPFGLLIILFKAVVTKKDREESLLVYLDALAAKLPLVEFYRNTFPTNAMKLAVANIYAEVTKLLDEALIYYRSGRLGKLVDAVLQPAESKFQKHITQIDAEVKKMESLKNVAHEAQTVDIKDIVTETGQVVSRLYDNFEKATVAIGISMELLNERMTGLESKIGQMGTFEMIKYAQSLEAALLISPADTYWDAEGSLTRLVSTGFRLSPKDHWENNGILENLVVWSHGRHGPLLWIGGISGNQDTWVTELSTDIVQAFLPQSLTLLYVFCSDLSSNSNAPTPTRLVKVLIGQILTAHPHLVYENPAFYSAQRFKHAVTFAQVWQIFESLVSSLSDVFLVIDRIEECVADDQADLTNNFLPSLTNLLQQAPGSRVIVTSIYEPPEELLEREDQGLFESVYIDTSRTSKHR